MLFLEDLRRDLSKVHNLRLAAFAIDIISGISEAVAIVLVSEIVVDIKVVFCGWSALLHSEKEVKPLSDPCRAFLAF